MYQKLKYVAKIRKYALKYVNMYLKDIVCLLSCMLRWEQKKMNMYEN
jgi:hypothetical protein